MTIGRHLLGRTLEHDPRSRNYDHARQVAAPKELRSVTHTLAAPHLDQGDLGSCEGNTAAEFLNCAKAIRNRGAYQNHAGRHGRWYLQENDAVSLYASATWLDNDNIPGVYPPSDTGTSGVGIAKAMQAAGAIERYNWTFTWDSYLHTLQTQPIMLGINWYDSMFYVNSRGFVVPPASSDSPAGGHAILAFAWRPAGRVGGVKCGSRTGCTNHWANDDGSPWGIRIGRYDGCFWIDDEVLEQLLIHEQGDSLVPVLM